jgi:hypothetical protein
MMKAESPTRVKISLTQDEWNDVLCNAMQPTSNGKDWKTVKELMKITGMGNNWVCQRIASEKEAGRIETRREMRMAIDDRLRATTVYRLKPTQAK